MCKLASLERLQAQSIMRDCWLYRASDVLQTEEPQAAGQRSEDLAIDSEIRHGFSKKGGIDSCRRPQQSPERTDRNRSALGGV